MFTVYVINLRIVNIYAIVLNRIVFVVVMQNCKL